jgi:mono/diheme cytochrome c family protein
MSKLAKLSALAAIALLAAAASRDPNQGQSPARPDPALVAKGDSVYHGRLGGAICHVCHGQNAKGMPGMGPDLTDGKWLHGDGSLAAIEATIKTGVPKPKVSSTVMPPGGGVPLDSLRVRAVAAYVYSLNAKR